MSAGKRIGKRIGKFYQDSGYDLDLNEDILLYLKEIVIKMVSAELYFNSLIHYSTALFYEKHIKEKTNLCSCNSDNRIKLAKEIYENYNYEEYFSCIKLSVIDIELNDIGYEYNDAESLYIPLENQDFVKPFIV